MTDPMGLTDFFAMEAGEYLERLDELVSSDTLNADELLRLARALRGSALMANQQTISTTAAAFERLVRTVREERVQWDEATKQLAIRAVDDLKVLVRDVRTWTEAHDTRARHIRQELESVAGPPTGLTGKQAAIRIDQELDTGTRAFIGREGAAVASALDQAAKGLQQNPLAYDPLQRVLKAMQPLRGLAVLNELPPMPDLLEGVEQAIGELERRTEPAADAALLFHAAAKALAAAAQEIATSGKANADSDEAQDFATRLGRLLEGDAVAIESLFFDDQGPHVVQKGTAPAGPARLGHVELVSHGEHLQKAADELDRAQSRTQKELRAQTLMTTFRALASQAGSPLANAVSDLAHAARDALTKGGALARTADFTKELRAAGKILGAAGQEDESSAAARLQHVVDALRRLAASAAPAAPAAPTAPTPGGHLHRPRAASAAVPAIPASPAPPAAPADTSEEETPTLAGSWARYERLVRERGLAPASLDELLSPAPAPHPVAATPPAPAAGVGTGAAAAGAVGGGEVVGIQTLLYTGRAALERAQSLRAEVRSMATDLSADRARLGALIEEIFDLVELGLEH